MGEKAPAKHLRTYLRFAYQFRRLNRARVAGLLHADDDRLTTLCDAIDRALPRERKRDFTFTGVDRTGRELIVCWELDAAGRPSGPSVFDGELAEHRAEVMRNLPPLNEARDILERRAGCARL